MLTGPPPGDGPATHFDAVIVGSGFGGSVMAYRLAQAGLAVCVLERGRRYPPGSFPRAPWTMRDNFWHPRSGRFGLFQVWKFRHMDAVVGAGLGGGSLIYANVLIRKDERWFRRRQPDGTAVPWPVTRAELDEHYARVESVLRPRPFPAGTLPYDTVAKTAAMRQAAERAGLEWSRPGLAVTFADGDGPPVPGEPIHGADGTTTGNLHGRTRTTCRLCAECDIGCNYGSKNTLDFTYLTDADRLGAEIRDRCTVHEVAPRPAGGFVVRYVHQGSDVAAPEPGAVTADRLVLAAGTIGTTELLLRNRRHFPHLSPTLGRGVSTNGDFLGFAHGARHEDGRPRLLAPSWGTAITSTARAPDTADGGNGPGIYFQEGGYPAIADWILEAADTPGAVGRAARYVWDQATARLTGRRRPNLGSQLARIVGEAPRSASLLPLLAMGLDPVVGTLVLRRGRLRCDWGPRGSDDYSTRVVRLMGELAAGMGAEMSVAPTAKVGRALTVHPLGGCRMGRHPGEGVVDRHGQVFGYRGLVIADGSVMPGAVGPNPSLTIAALADRFADQLA